MTCIVGVTDGDRVLLGSDSAVSWFWPDHQERQAVKVRELGSKAQRFLYGGAGSVRVLDVLSYSLELGKVEPLELWRRKAELGIEEVHRAAPEAWVRLELVPKIRAECKAAGVLEVKDGVESIEASIMIGLEGRLFTIWRDLSVLEAPACGAAIGSGRQLALGSLWSTWRARRLDVQVSPRMFEAFARGDGSAVSVAKLEGRAELALEAAAEFSASVRPPFSFLELEP